jgi:hypothetical protein
LPGSVLAIVVAIVAFLANGVATPPAARAKRAPIIREIRALLVIPAKLVLIAL